MLPKKTQKHYIIIIILLVLSTKLTHAQSNEDSNPLGIRMGLHYGYGMNLTNDNYNFEVNFFKIQIYKPLIQAKFDLELLFQPEYNRAHHQLLNESFIPLSDPDYLEKRDLFTTRRPINEYALNIGMLTRYHLSEKVSVYILGSIGPLIADAETERQAKGFAFTDNIMLGMSFRFKHLVLDIRPGLRHVSNADIQLPNAGHNTTNLEIGLSYKL